MLAEAPPERDFADLAAAVLRAVPRASTIRARRRRCAAGCSGRDRFLYGQPGFDAKSMNRLAAASGVLPEELQALAALAGGELSRAEMLEEHAQAQWSEPSGST